MDYSFQQASHRIRSPTNIFSFSAYRNCKAQAGSCPLHAWLRPRSSMSLSLKRFLFFTAQSPCALFLPGFLFSALCRCQGSSRLKPFYLTIMVQTGSSQQNSSQLSFKRFLFLFFSQRSRMVHSCPAPVSRLPTRKEPNRIRLIIQFI
jgi:hypothetical protein